MQHLLHGKLVLNLQHLLISDTKYTDVFRKIIAVTVRII